MGLNGSALKLGLATIAVLLSGAILRAQVTTADVLGTITDPSGAVVPGAKATLQNLDTGISRSLEVGASGDYLFTLLPIGRYSIKIEAPGFKAFSVGGITLQSGDRTRVDAHMELGQLGESVQVEAQAAALQTDTSTVGTLMTQRAVQDLPLINRNFITLAQVVPGASEGAPNALNSGTRPDDRRPSSAVAINGGALTNYMIDGMDNNDRLIGTVIVRPSIDALAEARVQTNLYTAEVTRVSGGVINLLTKSGTNAYHGTLYEYFRNDVTDAKNFFLTGQPRPEFRQNQFGGSLGGVIRKDKTFFFVDNENSRLRQGSAFTAIVPTQAMVNGNFSALLPSTIIRSPFTGLPYAGNIIPKSDINPIGQKIAQLYPAPNLPSTSTSSAQFGSALVKSQDYSTMDVRIDQHISDKDFFYGRYSFNDVTSFIPPGFPAVNGVYPGGNAGAFPGPALQRAQGAQLNYVHVLGPTLVAEFKGGWSRFANRTQNANVGQNVSQALGITGANHNAISSGLSLVQPSGFESLGDASFVPIIQIDNTFQYSGAFTWTRGSHTIKFGAQVIRRQALIAQSSFPRGQYTFDGSLVGNPIAALLLGVPTTAQLVENTTWPGYRIWEPGFYVQDDWRATSKLTLNIGLRYDVFTPLSEVHNQIANFDPSTGKIIIAGVNGVSNTAGVKTDYKDFAPRFGFAYTPTKGLVIRGGFGLSFAPTSLASGIYLKNPPFVAGVNFNNTGLTLPLAASAYNISQGFPPAVAVNPANPTVALNATTEDFKSTYVEQYNLTVQKEIAKSVVSVGYVAALSRRLADGYDLNEALPGLGAVNPRRPYFAQYPAAAAMNYIVTDGLADYHSLQASFERRLANGLVVNSNYTWAHSIQSDASVAIGGVGGTPLSTNRRTNRGNAPEDIRNRWTLALNYELPFAKSAKGFVRQAFGGWQMNAILVASSGRVFSVQNNSAVANTGVTGVNDRPNRIASGNLANPTLAEWFDITAFKAQTTGTIGNAGVNILRGPGYFQQNASIFKNFKLTEAFNLQFRAETFNLSNSPIFAVPNSALGGPNFGVITSTVATSTPRQFQFALKLLF